MARMGSKKTPMSYQRRSASQRGQRTAWVKPTAGAISTGPAWTEVSSHAAERFADRFRPDLMIDEATDLLMEVGKSAVLFGESNGGKMFFSSEHPMCGFLVRDSPGALVSVFDRNVGGGYNTLAARAADREVLEAESRGEMLEELPPCADGDDWNATSSSLIEFRECLQTSFRRADIDDVFASRERLLRCFDRAAPNPESSPRRRIPRTKQMVSLIFIEIAERQRRLRERLDAGITKEEKLFRMQRRKEQWEQRWADPRATSLGPLPHDVKVGTYSEGVVGFINKWYPPLPSQSHNVLVRNTLMGGRALQGFGNRAIAVLGWSGHIGVFVRHGSGQWALDIFLPPPFEYEQL